MKIRLVRHATLILTIEGTKLLVDPILSPVGALPPIDNSPNPLRNPLVSLAVDEKELLAVDAVLLTHTHRDHFDQAASEKIPRDMTIFCQSADEDKLKDLGFSCVSAISGQLNWNGLSISRVGGRHGTGAVGEKMGVVSGYVLRQTGQPTLYIAGDTIWCPEVEQALTEHNPDVVVVFAGAAQFLTGGPITMDAGDVIKVCRQNPAAKIIAVHMETFNHCLLTRQLLREQLANADLLNQVAIPADGETLILG